MNPSTYGVVQQRRPLLFGYELFRLASVIENSSRATVAAALEQT
jgi:hypothetical protein